MSDLKAWICTFLVAVLALVLLLLGIGAFGFVLTKLDEIHPLLGILFVIVAIAASFTGFAAIVSYLPRIKLWEWEEEEN